MRSYEEALSRYSEFLDAGQKKQIRKRAQQLSTQHAEQRRQIESGAKQGLKQMNDSLSAYGLANNLQRKPSSGIDERVRQMPEMNQNLRKLEAAETAQLDPYARQQAQNTINARIAAQQKRSYDMVYDRDPITGEIRKTASGKLKWRVKTQADWDAERAAKAKEAEISDVKLPPAMSAIKKGVAVSTGGTPVTETRQFGNPNVASSGGAKVTVLPKLDDTLAAAAINANTVNDANRPNVVKSVVGSFYSKLSSTITNAFSKFDTDSIKKQAVNQGAFNLIDYCESIYVISHAQADGMRGSVSKGRSDLGVLKDYLLERIALSYARSMEVSTKNYSESVNSGLGVGVNNPYAKAFTESYRRATESGKTEDFEDASFKFVTFVEQTADTRYQAGTGLLAQLVGKGLDDYAASRAQTALRTGDDVTFNNTIASFLKEKNVGLYASALQEQGVITEEQAEYAQKLIDAGEYTSAVDYIEQASRDYAAGVMKEQCATLWQAVMDNQFYAKKLATGGSKLDDFNSVDSALYATKFAYEEALEWNDIEHWQSFIDQFKHLCTADNAVTSVTYSAALGEAERGGLDSATKEQAWEAWRNGDYNTVASLLEGASYMDGIVGYDNLHIRNQQLQDIAGITVADFHRYQGVSDEALDAAIENYREELKSYDRSSAVMSTEAFKSGTEYLSKRLAFLEGIRAVRNVDKNTAKYNDYCAMDEDAIASMQDETFKTLDALYEKNGFNNWSNEAEFITQEGFDREGTRGFTMQTLLGYGNRFENEEDAKLWNDTCQDLMILKAAEAAKWKQRRDLEYQAGVTDVLESEDFAAFKRKGYNYNKLVESSGYNESKGWFGDVKYYRTEQVGDETAVNVELTGEERTAMLLAKYIDLGKDEFTEKVFGNLVTADVGHLSGSTARGLYDGGEVSGLTANDIADYYDNMTAVEKDIFKYRCMQGLDSAVEYLDFIKPYITERKMNAVQEMANEMADTAPVFSHCITYATKPLEAVGGMYTLYKTIRDEKIDPNSGFFFFTVFDNTIRQNHYDDVKTSLTKSLGDGLASAGTFLFQTFDSIIDSRVNAAIGGTVAGGASGWTEAVSLPLMGFSAAADTAREMSAKGIPDKEVKSVAIAAGVFEALFEVASLEQILHGADDLSLGKGVRMAIGGGIEGSEELFTEYANMGAQAVILKGHDQWSEDVQSILLKDGGNLATAQAKATLSAVGELLLATIGGTISGEISAAINNVKVDRKLEQSGEAIRNTDGRLQQLIDSAIENGGERLRDAAIKIQGLIANNANVSNMEIGQFNYLVATNTVDTLSKSINKLIDEGTVTLKQGLEAKNAVEAMGEAMIFDPTIAINGISAENFFGIVGDISAESFSIVSNALFDDVMSTETVQEGTNQDATVQKTLDRMEKRTSAKDRKKERRERNKAETDRRRLAKAQAEADAVSKTVDVAINGTDSQTSDTELTPAQKEIGEFLQDARDAGYTSEADALAEAVTEATAAKESVSTKSPYLNAIIGATQNTTEETLKKIKASDKLQQLRTQVKDLRQQLKEAEKNLKTSQKETKEAYKIGEKVLRLTEKEAKAKLKELEKQFNRELKSAIDWMNKDTRRAVAEAKKDMSIKDKQKFDARMAKAKEKAEVKKWFNKDAEIITQLHNELVNPQQAADKRIPSALQKTYTKLFDLLQVSQDEEGLRKKDIKLTDIIEDAQQFVADAPKVFGANGDPAYTELYNQTLKELAPKLESLQGYLDFVADNAIDDGKLTLRNLDSRGLRTLYDTLAIFRNFATTFNKTYSGIKAKTIAETNSSLRSEYEQKNAHHMSDSRLQKAIRSYLLGANANMYTIMNLSSDTMKELYGKINEGWKKYAFKVGESADFIDSLYGKYGVRKRERGHWRNDVKAHKLSNGETIHCTDAQIMYLYAMTFNENGTRHALGGVGVENGNAAQKNVSTDHIFDMSEADIDSLCNTLSNKQKGYVLDMLNDTSTRLRDLCNEVSQKKFMVDMFNEENYMPIKTAERVRETVMPSKDSTINGTMNASATKARTKASNPLLLSDIFNVYADYSNWVAQYNTLGLPMEDMLRVMNYVPTDANGKANFNQSNAHFINEMMGKTSGTQFAVNLIKDITGMQENSRNDLAILDKLAGNYRKAKIAFKASVIMKQLTAIPRACVYIPAIDFANTKHFNVKKNIAEMQEHSGIAKWKADGNFEIGLGKTSRQMVLGSDTFAEMYNEQSMAGAAAADDLGWSWIWAASKRNVERTTKLQYGTDEYWSKVTEVFDQAVTNTQVFDSPLSRTQAMRSQNSLLKQAASFKSEPQTMLNMLMTAVGQKDPAKVIKTVLFTSVAQALEAAVSTATRWVKKYGEDAEEDYYDYYLDQFKSNVNPLNNMLGISEIMTLLDGYKVERQDLAGFREVVDAYNQAKRYINGNGGSVTDYKVWKDSITALFDVCGLPADGIFQITDTIFKVTNLNFGTNIHEYNPTMSKVKAERDEFGKVVTSARENKFRKLAQMTYDKRPQQEIDSLVESLGEEDKIRLETAHEYGLTTKNYIDSALYKETLGTDEYVKWLIERSGYTPTQQEAIYKMFVGKEGRDISSYIAYEISANSNNYAAFNYAKQNGMSEEMYYEWFNKKREKLDNQFGGDRTKSEKEFRQELIDAVQNGDITTREAEILDSALLNEEQPRDYSSAIAFEMSANETLRNRHSFAVGHGLPEEKLWEFQQMYEEKAWNEIGGTKKLMSKDEFINAIYADPDMTDEQKVTMYKAFYPNDSKIPDFSNDVAFDMSSDESSRLRYNFMDGRGIPTDIIGEYEAYHDSKTGNTVGGERKEFSLKDMGRKLVDDVASGKITIENARDIYAAYSPNKNYDDFPDFSSEFAYEMSQNETTRNRYNFAKEQGIPEDVIKRYEGLFTQKDANVVGGSKKTLTKKEFDDIIAADNTIPDEMKPTLHTMYFPNDENVPDFSTEISYEMSKTESSKNRHDYALENGLSEEIVWEIEQMFTGKLLNEIGGTKKEYTKTEIVDHIASKENLTEEQKVAAFKTYYPNDTKIPDFSSHVAYEMSKNDASYTRYRFWSENGLAEDKMLRWERWMDRVTTNSIGGEKKALNQKETADALMKDITTNPKEKSLLYRGMFPNVKDEDMPDFTNIYRYEAKRDLTPTRYARVESLKLTDNELKLLIAENNWYKERKAKTGFNPTKDEWRKYLRENKSTYGVTDESVVRAVLDSDTFYKKYLSNHRR